ncbi:MAG TPA: hypothetical protein VLT62_12185 [Candidatus Methylomirabilis sp.]|nr:hypothetical protein [Candidatus Methylomirabilis sp.]
MDTRFLRYLVVGLVAVVMLSGCATTVARQDVGGLPNADHPEYLAHPFRVLGLGVHFTGNLLQYVLVEPFYFLLTPIPEAVGLSLEERAYLEKRQEAWSQWLAGERPAVQ